MAQLPKEVKEVLDLYGMDHREACWLHKQSRKWVITHRACEQIGTLAGVRFPDPPEVVVCDVKNSTVVLLGTAERDINNRTEKIWATGEAGPGNCRIAYPVSIAEKRLKDRLILKLVFSGIHGALYSEAEADEFSPPSRDQTAGPSDYEQVAKSVLDGIWAADSLSDLMALGHKVRELPDAVRDEVRPAFKDAISRLKAEEPNQ